MGTKEVVFLKKALQGAVKEECHCGEMLCMVCAANELHDLIGLQWPALVEEVAISVNGFTEKLIEGAKARGEQPAEFMTRFMVFLDEGVLEIVAERFRGDMACLCGQKHCPVEAAGKIFVAVEKQSPEKLPAVRKALARLCLAMCFSLLVGQVVKEVETLFTLAVTASLN